MHRFWDIRLVSIQWPWNPGLGLFKVIENDTIRSVTHDVLLMFHSNHRPISYCFQDKWRFLSNIANFSHPRVFNTPTEGVSLGIWYRRNGPKSYNHGATRWSKKFSGRFSLLDTIAGGTDGRMERRTRCRSKDRAILRVGDNNNLHLGLHKMMKSY